MYWVSVSQAAHFATEIGALKSSTSLLKSGLYTPFLDKIGILCVGGRQQNSKLSYDSQLSIPSSCMGSTQ